MIRGRQPIVGLSTLDMVLVVPSVSTNPRQLSHAEKFFALKTKETNKIRAQCFISLQMHPAGMHWAEAVCHEPGHDRIKMPWEVIIMSPMFHLIENLLLNEF